MTNNTVTTIEFDKSTKILIAGADLVVGILLESFKRYQDIDKFVFDDSYTWIFDDKSKNINPGILVALTTKYVNMFLNTNLGMTSAMELSELLPSRVYHTLSVDSINANITEYTLELIEESLNDFNKIQYLPNERINYKTHKDELVNLIVNANYKLKSIKDLNKQYKDFAESFVSCHEQIKKLKKEPVVFITDIDKFLPTPTFRNYLLNNEPFIDITDIDLTLYAEYYNHCAEDITDTIIKMANAGNPIINDITQHINIDKLNELIIHLLFVIKLGTRPVIVRELPPDGEQKTLNSLIELRILLIATIICKSLSTNEQAILKLSQIELNIKAILIKLIKALEIILSKNLIWIQLTERKIDDNIIYEYNVNTNSFVAKKLLAIDIKSIIHALYLEKNIFLNNICVITYSKLMSIANELKHLYKKQYDESCSNLYIKYKEININNLLSRILLHCQYINDSLVDKNINLNIYIHPKSDSVDGYITAVNDALYELGIINAHDLKLLTDSPSNTSFIDAALSLFE